MTRVQILPTVMIVISLASAVVYMPSGDWRSVMYWVSAAFLTFSVTF